MSSRWATVLLVATAACSEHAAAPVPVTDVDPGEFAVFHEVVAARVQATEGANRFAPAREGLPAGPTPRQKGTEKREAIISRYVERATAQIAARFGMSREQVLEIYERGIRERWPPRQ